MKSILITGGGGYIGSHAVKSFLKQGFTIVVFDNFSHGFREPLEILKRYGELFVVEGDLVNKKDIEKVFQVYEIDLVIHFAALCSVDESMREPELYFRNNVLGTLNLLEAMQENGVKKIIFSSTCAVYGNAEYLPIDEKHRTKPENPYGESKLMAEKIIEWFGKIHDLHYVTLRYFNVCGADSDGEIGDSKRPSSLLVQNAVRGALGIEDFKLTCPRVDTPDGTPIRDYIDVEDLVDVHTKAYEYLDQGGASEVFNLGNGVGWSVKEIVNAVQEVLKKKFIITSDSPRQGEYGEVYANTSKVAKTLNFHPKKNLNKSIQSLSNWYLKYPNGYKS